MEQTMMWVALGMGVAGWICSALLAQLRTPSGPSISAPSGSNGVSSSFLWLALALPFVVWLLTLPTSPPFSPGQGWGRGFLMGGLASWLCTFALLKANGEKAKMAATSPLFAAIVIACIPLQWMRHAVIEALVGAALGWVAVTLVFLLGKNASDSDTNDSLSPLLLNGAAFTTAICAVAGLGVYRDFVIASVPRGTYSAVAMVMAGVVGLTLLIGALITDIVRGARPSLKPLQVASTSTLLTAFLSLVMPLGLSALLSVKVLDDLGLTYVIGMGALLGFVLWWLVADGVSTDPEILEERPMQVPVAAMLVALCAFMLAYQLMQGFGVGLMLLAAWPVSILAGPSSTLTLAEADASLSSHRVSGQKTSQALTLLLSFVAILLLSRLFEMRFRADLRGASLSDQFALFGFLCGATIPSLLASLALPPLSASSRSLLHSVPVRAALPRLFLVGVLALFLPTGMVALWGAKVLPACFAGLALATMLPVSAWKQSSQPSVIAAFSLAISLALTQWTHHFAPLAEASRTQRLHFLLWALGGLLVLILIFDYSSRLTLVARQRKQVNSKGVAP